MVNARRSNVNNEPPDVEAARSMSAFAPGSHFQHHTCREIYQEILFVRIAEIIADVPCNCHKCILSSTRQCGFSTYALWEAFLRPI